MKNREKTIASIFYFTIFAIFSAGYLSYSAELSQAFSGGSEFITNQGVIRVEEPHQAWIQLAALAVSAGIGIWKGVKQNKAAKRLEQMNERPDYRISRGTLTNLALTKRAAEEGLPTEVSNNYVSNLRLGLSTSLRNNALYGGRGANITSALRTYNQGLDNLSAADAEARVRNRRDLLEANKQLSEEEQNLYKSEMQEYQEKASLASGLRSAGQENIYSSIGTGLSFAASGGFDKKPATTTSKTPEIPDYASSTINSGLYRDWNKLSKNIV